MDTKNVYDNKYFGKFFKKALSIKNIAKNEITDEKSKISNDNIGKNNDEKENLDNLLNILHYDSILLKAAIFHNNQCINEVNIS